MITSKNFLEQIDNNNLGPILEVPCSIFKSLINYMQDQGVEIINPVNESILMANAAGEYLSTGKIPVVMMQNSGLNNTLNALTSLNKQYQIPAVYLISWRGELKDAPEHNFMGNNLEKILMTFQIPFKILTQNYSKEIGWAASLAEQTKQPIALIMREGFIEKYEKKIGVQDESGEYALINQVDAINALVENSEGYAYISSTGFPSRILFNVLKQKGKEDGRAFFMLGSMGHALGIGQSIVKRLPKSKIMVIDGDGSALMHLGSMAGSSKKETSNLVQVILDNQIYGSTGGQPTLSENINFKKIGEGMGYEVQEAKNELEIANALKNLSEDKPNLIHIKINKNAAKGDMGRVTHSCDEIKARFERYLNNFK